MHPGAVAGAVVALQQTVDERAAAALDQRVRVAQLQEPAPEPAACEGAGAAAHLLQRDAWPRRNVWWRIWKDDGVHQFVSLSPESLMASRAFILYM